MLFCALCVPLREDFLLEEMCEVALTCHFSLDVPLSGLSGSVFLEFHWWSVRPLLQFILIVLSREATVRR